jgi:hypothetical protein
MRDIRQDLRERLDAITADRATLQKRLTALEERENTLKSMLAEEESRILDIAADRPQLPFAGVTLVGGMQMTNLIKNTLRAKVRRLTFDEVKDEITKTAFDFGGQKPGRVVHGGLLSLVRTREITKDADGRYGLLINNNGIAPREMTH